ncbi:hypothetical protein sscle_08g063390 [Sclerotinia sclerotiorum 1980 UF-70]|uniref:Rhodopsin domain-containing protein n=1 Tax=Sclerotinia sclerotiorum (strain ATCC 18683 / 1980 / Ss-1) TaxID=665079 RepID=A0A1D9Q9K3_SCLS1|nr:hypothetical protein sscle_08g063390 [Sclerotinia sclerotiorum 1980 UF-70]
MPTLWVYNSTPEINAQSNYPLILEASFPLLVLMLITVGTRLYVRVRTVRGIGADDWAVVTAAICSIVYNACTISQSRWGLGLPLALRPAVNLNEYSKVNYAGRPFYMIGVLCFKVSLCFSYLRILSKGQPNYRLLVWFVMILCILGHVAGTLALMFNCHPVQKSWLPKTPGKCLPVGPLFFGLAITTIVFDVIIFFLPIPFLYGLRMDNRKKFGIIGVFALGIFTTVCSVLRMSEIPVITNGSGDSTMLVVWGNIELNVGIILTCMPVLAPLFKIFGKKLTSSGKTGSSNPYAHNESHNMQVFSHGKSANGKSAHRTTITNLNMSSSRKERASRALRYPGDVSDNESQETILGKSGEEGVREGESGVSGNEERGGGSRNSGESKGGDGIGMGDVDLNTNGNGNTNGKEIEGIMRTVQIEVSSEERGIHDEEFADESRRGNR